MNLRFIRFLTFGVLSISIMLVVGITFAQTGTTPTTTPTPTTTTSTGGFTSTIEYYGVLCEDRIIITLSGTMQSGYDVFYQVFSGSQGSGTALTSLRQVQVSGAYSVTDTTTYTGGTLASNTVGSFYVAIGREGAASTTLYTDTVDDLQDGCTTTNTGAPISTDTGGTTGTTGGTGTTTTTTTTISNGQFSDGTSAILSPLGGYLNPNYIPPEKPLVEIGPADEYNTPRQETPGLVFAECEDYPVAEPGIIYDTDNVIVFWSWFTDTEEQMLDHIANVDYSVTYYQTLPLPSPQRTEIRAIGGSYWVFYYSVLGNLRPGQYYIEYKTFWDEPHFDGYDEYGPGTENEALYSGCEFVVLPNTQGRSVSHNPWPYQYLNP